MTLAPAPERNFAHYEVERPLGRGAIGMVYLARDVRIGRRVALKTIQVDASRFEDTTAADEFYERLQREAEVCGALLHPNLVTLYETGYEEERVSWLAMEYIEGETLQKMIDRLGRIPAGDALRIIEGVLRGLEYAHAKGIVHRDVKPANVLIAADGMVKIADFGIARLPHSSLTGAGSLMGTPNYISPEQILGRTATTRADIFSTGAMFYEMLTGMKPFAGEHVTAVLHNVLRREVPHATYVNPGVPREAGDFVVRMLEKSPDVRPSASEALVEIERLQSAQPATVVPAAPARWNWRPAAAISAIATVVIAAIWLVSLLAISRSATPPPAFTAAQLDEFAQKRRALHEADALLGSGKYADAVQRYDAYLAKYPWSTAARDARDRAATAAGAPKPAAKRHRHQEEDISPAELLRRIKRVFKP